jgi:hypothetical protein
MILHDKAQEWHCRGPKAEQQDGPSVFAERMSPLGPKVIPCVGQCHFR